MTRPERFDHYQYEVHDPARGRKRRLAPTVAVLAIASLAIVAGVGLYHYRAPLQIAAAAVAAKVQQGVKTHFAAGFALDAVIPFVKDLVSDQAPPASSRQGAATVGSDDSAAFLYTVELTDGGRIEGRDISVDRQTVTVVDAAGVTIRVDRVRVARIRKMPR